jgi:chromosome segregation ATPase
VTEPELPWALEALSKVGLFVGSILAGAYLTWKVRDRKEEGKKKEKTPYRVLDIEDDAHPRVITRKEWHDMRGHIDRHGYALENLKNAVGTLETAFEEHLKQSNEAMAGFTRLEAGFEAHRERWEEVGQRAAEDRREMRQSLEDMTKEIREIRREMK